MNGNRPEAPPAVLLQVPAFRELFSKKGRTYAAGDIVFLEDERGEEMFVIVAGEVEILKTYKEIEIFGGSKLTLGSEPEVINTLGAGDFFGEMALFNDRPRMATARAKTKVEVIVLSRADVEALMRASPDLAVHLVRSLCNRLRDAERTPRVETVLPKLQAMLREMQRVARRGAGAGAGAAPRAKVQPAGAAKAVAPSPKPPPRCRFCDRAVSEEWRYCAYCGKAI